MAQHRKHHILEQCRTDYDILKLKPVGLCHINIYGLTLDAENLLGVASKEIKYIYSQQIVYRPSLRDKWQLETQNWKIKQVRAACSSFNGRSPCSVCKAYSTVTQSLVCVQ